MPYGSCIAINYLINLLLRLKKQFLFTQHFAFRDMKRTGRLRPVLKLFTLLLSQYNLITTAQLKNIYHRFICQCTCTTEYKT